MVVVEGCNGEVFEVSGADDADVQLDVAPDGLYRRADGDPA